jgi:hypothetical protein
MYAVCSSVSHLKLNYSPKYTATCLAIVLAFCSSLPNSFPHSGTQQSLQNLLFHSLNYKEWNSCVAYTRDVLERRPTRKERKGQIRVEKKKKKRSKSAECAKSREKPKHPTCANKGKRLSQSDKCLCETPERDNRITRGIFCVQKTRKKQG